MTVILNLVLDSLNLVAQETLTNIIVVRLKINQVHPLHALFKFMNMS
jgi:hypothetical protein